MGVKFKHRMTQQQKDDVDKLFAIIEATNKRQPTANDAATVASETHAATKQHWDGIAKRQQLDVQRGAAAKGRDLIAENARAASAKIVTMHNIGDASVFQIQMRDARKEMMSATVNRLVATSLNAVEVLHSVANDPSAEHSAKVAASRSLLQYSIQAGVVDEIQSRLAQLESGGSDD